MMSKTTDLHANQRNQSVECCRLVAAVFVVFLHYNFPGTFGAVMEGLSRFAVPFFFVVSGYYCYQVNTQTIKRRLIGITKLNIYATILYLLWGCYKIRYIQNRSIVEWLISMVSSQNLANWFLLSKNPFSGHLWYLTAMMLCYAVLYLYTSWKNEKIEYNTLYQTGFSLYIVQLALGSFANAAGAEIHYNIYRNAVFFGFPMVCLGLFLREYQQKMLQVYQLTKPKLIFLVFVGACLTILERIGIGKVELPVGSLISTIFLMLLVVTNPKITGTSGRLAAVISTFGSLSTYVYVTHPLWKEIYDLTLLHTANMVFGETLQGYLAPVLIVGISILTGIIWNHLYCAFRCIVLERSSGKEEKS